jgi:hypothetical protein
MKYALVDNKTSEVTRRLNLTKKEAGALDHKFGPSLERRLIPIVEGNMPDHDPLTQRIETEEEVSIREVRVTYKRLPIDQKVIDERIAKKADRKARRAKLKKVGQQIGRLRTEAKNAREIVVTEESILPVVQQVISNLADLVDGIADLIEGQEIDNE